ncbi:MAG: hypothetical protein K0R61_142 [Microvirga sp.]|jgi:hypothetical protein|nr:hypothetical protein [Microvirga sp.]
MAEGEQHQQRWNESSTDSWRREMRELILDARNDFRERINELKTGVAEVKAGMNDQLSSLQREVGALKEGKADKSEVASKQTQTLVYGAVGVFLFALVTVVANYFIRPPDAPPAISAKP